MTTAPAPTATPAAAPAVAVAAEPWTHHYASVNGVRLHYVEAGTGPLVVLLHGFPEFWYSWRHQIPALAAAGHRVIAPDLRGYNLSDKPRDVAAYRIDTLAEDVAALIRHAGEERADVVGHDWGGAVAWFLPLLRPEVVRKLAILNSPHPARFVKALRTLRQLGRSWYMFLFQLPWLPEKLLAYDDFAPIGQALRRFSARPDCFSDEEIRRYQEAAGRPGAATGSINYYRAAMRYGARAFIGERRRVACPTLLIWGAADQALGIELTQGLERWVDDLRVELIPEASHWVQNEAPARVNELLVDFLRA